MENNGTENVVNVNNEVKTTNEPIVGNENANVANNKGGEVKEKIKKYLPFIIGGVIVVVLLVFLFSALFGGGATRAVNGYFSGYKKMDAEKVVKYLYFDDKDDRKDTEDDIEEGMDSDKDDDIVIKSYKIVDSYKANKDELKDIGNSLENIYDIDDDDVTAAATYAVKVVVDNDGDREIEYVTVGVFKLKGKWYVLDFN